LLFHEFIEDGSNLAKKLGIATFVSASQPWYFSFDIGKEPFDGGLVLGHHLSNFEALQFASYRARHLVDEMDPPRSLVN
jgi:hypothetical protein